MINDKQFQFTYMVSQLINFAYFNGYTLTFGDAFVEDGREDGHKEDSFHYSRLAIDLNLFKDGEYLTKTKDHEPLGDFWLSIGGSWGGDWNDGNHYSLGE